MKSKLLKIHTKKDRTVDVEVTTMIGGKGTTYKLYKNISKSRQDNLIKFIIKNKVQLKHQNGCMVAHIGYGLKLEI